jgi:energy-coupling factor transporter ATP-binding protein EcfA2
LTTDTWAQTFLSDDDIEYFVDYCLRTVRNHPANKQGQAILLIGEAGAGKSAILRAITRRAAKELSQSGSKRGAVMIEMPIPCTNRAISLEYRRALGDEAKSGSATDNLDVAKTLWGALGTKVMAIDEGHNMGEDKVDLAVSKRHFVKRTLNIFKGVCIFAGTPALLPLFESDPELRRRVRFVWHIPTWELTVPDQLKSFRKFLRRLDDAAGMSESAELHKPDRALRIAAATGCKRGITYDFISYARSVALSKGAPRITDAHLETAFFDFLAHGNTKIANPFDPNRRL